LCVAEITSKSPPLKSAPRLRSPFMTKTPRQSTVATADIETNLGAFPRKSNPFERIRCSMDTRLSQPSANAQEKQVYVTSSDENNEATKPMVSVSVKPLTGPLASQKRIAAVRNCVTCASKMALNAFRYDVSMGERRDFCLISSRSRS